MIQSLLKWIINILNGLLVFKKTLEVWVFWYYKLFAIRFLITKRKLNWLIMNQFSRTSMYTFKTKVLLLLFLLLYHYYFCEYRSKILFVDETHLILNKMCLQVVTEGNFPSNDSLIIYMSNIRVCRQNIP